MLYMTYSLSTTGILRPSLPLKIYLRTLLIVDLRRFKRLQPADQLVETLHSLTRITLIFVNVIFEGRCVPLCRSQALTRHSAWKLGWDLKEAREVGTSS
jgi:hypothetical protein